MNRIALIYKVWTPTPVELVLRRDVTSAIEYLCT